MNKNKDRKSRAILVHRLILFLFFLSIISISLFFNFQKINNDHRYPEFESTVPFETSSVMSNGFLHEESIINCSESTGRIYVTDANGDGYNDVFVGEWYHNFFTVLYWNPTIRYWDPLIRKNTISYTGRIIVRDVNNDGKKDVITLSYLGPIEIRLWDDIIGDWNNTLVKEPCLYPYDICIGDANNDNINDIIVLDQYGESSIYIYCWNQTKGDFTKITKTIDHVSSEVKVADVNNDGLNEIITFTFNPNRLVIYYWNQTSGDWTMDTKTVRNPCYIDYFSIGDVNNDGYNDVIFATKWDDHNLVMLLWNQTLSDWDNEITMHFNSRLRDVEIGDINNDCQNDIVIGRESEYSILCWNKSIASWNPPINSSMTGGSNHNCILIDDINNDGIPDLLMRNVKMQGFSLFLGYYSIETPVLEPISPYINYDNNVMLRWNSIENATIYYIYREIEEIISTNDATPIATISTTNYTDYVPINGKYNYAIVAGDRLAQSLISNNRDVLVVVNLTSKLLYTGKTIFEIDSNCNNDDINLSISLSLTNDTTIFYSCYYQAPNNISLENSLLFFELIINNTYNIDGEINFTIYFNTLKYVNLSLCALNFNFKDGTGEWEKVEVQEENSGLIIISVGYQSHFALSKIEILDIDKEQNLITGYDLFFLLILISLLSVITFNKYKNARK